MPQERIPGKALGLQRHERFFLCFAAVDNHRALHSAGQGKLITQGLILDFPRAVGPVKIQPYLAHGLEPGVSGKSRAHGGKTLLRAVLSIAGVYAHEKKHFGVGVKISTAGMVFFRPQKDVAHLGNTCRMGAFKHGIAIRIKFLTIKVRVAVHAGKGQGQSQGINTDG